MDRRHLRRSPHAVPAGSRQAGGGHDAHGAAGAQRGGARCRAQHRRERRPPDRDGRDRRRHPARGVRRHDARHRDPTRHAAHRAARTTPSEGEARAGRAPDRRHVRSGGTRQGARVRDRSDAVGRAIAPRCALPDRRPDPSGTPPPPRRGVPQQAHRDDRKPRSRRQRRLPEPVPAAEGHHRAAARDRYLRDPVPRPEPDHERHAELRARSREGRRVDAVPACHRGARRRAWAAGRLPRPRRAVVGDQRDPRRPGAEGEARAQRLRLRQRVHVAQDGHAVRRGHAGVASLDAREATDPGTTRRMDRGAGRRQARRQSPHHPRRRAAVAARHGDHLDDQRRCRARGR